MIECLWQPSLPLCNDCSKAVLLAGWGLLALEPTGRYSSNGKDPTTIPPPPDEVPLSGYLTVRPPGATEAFIREYLAIIEPESLGGDDMDSTRDFGIS